jgi:hypothetical protein
MIKIITADTNNLFPFTKGCQTFWRKPHPADTHAARPSRFSTEFSFKDVKIAPSSTFRNTAGQIDGSFRLNDELYWMEAKWHQNRTPAADLKDTEHSSANQV